MAISALLQETGDYLFLEDGFEILLESSGDVVGMRGGMTRAKVESHGYLLVSSVAAGAAGTPRQLQSLTLGLGTATGYLVVTKKTGGSQQSQLTPLAHLKLSTDANGSLQVVEKTAGSTETRLTPLANLKCRTDENGYLHVAYKTPGTNGPLCDFLNLRGRTDENGALLVSEGV